MPDTHQPLTPEDRRRAVAALLAEGLRRCLTGETCPPAEPPENPSEILASALELHPRKSVTVHTG